MKSIEALTILLERVRALDTRTLVLLAALTGAAITLMYRPLSQPEAGDTAIYDYIAQSILRGQVPYRDVVDIKGPLAPILSALSIVIGKAVGLRDIIAIRLSHVLFVGLLAAVTFLLVEALFHSRAAGIIAFLIPLMLGGYLGMMVAGTQPKLPMMFFGMLSLLLIAKDRPFWSGFCSMLSCLCWQPGLMFTGVAFLMFSYYLTSWRDLRALKVLVGAGIPLAVTVIYFFFRGALGDMWAWAMVYNYSVFGPAATRSFGEALDHFGRVMYRLFYRSFTVLYAGGLGLLMFLAERLKEKVKRRGPITAPDLCKDAIVIVPLIYLGFCFVNLQSIPDLIPLVPFVGIFAALLIIRAGRAAAKIRFGGKPLLRGLEAIVPGVAIAAILLLGLYRGVRYRVEGWTLEYQYKVMETISSLLGPDDRIYVHGTVEILTLLNRPNLNPYVFLDWGADDFAASRRNTTFAALIDEMDGQAPKLVSITRLRKVNHRAELEKWLADQYDRVEGLKYDPVYIRRR